MPNLKLAAAIVVAAALSLPAEAKDLLPLKQGIFVDAEIPCTEFGRAYLTELHVANKYAMGFWGDSVNDAFTIGKIIKVKRDGQTYKVALDSKTDSPMGNFTGVIDQTFVISSPTRLRTDRGYGQATFRWCYKEIP